MLGKVGTVGFLKLCHPPLGLLAGNNFASIETHYPLEYNAFLSVESEVTLPRNM
jgi:hypothetical protein